MENSEKQDITVSPNQIQVLKKTVTFEMHSFTTERKPKPKTTINIARKGSIVKERCRQLCEILSELYPDRQVPAEDLEYMVKRYIGADKETVRAYLGYIGMVQRSKRTGEGYVRGQLRKGYLEEFGFMHRLNRETWLLHYQTKLPEYNQENELSSTIVSDTEVQNAETFSNTNEVSSESCSKEKISISYGNTPFINCEAKGERGKLPLEEKNIEVSPVTLRGDMGGEKQNNNNNTTERERNFTPKIMPQNISDMPKNTSSTVGEVEKTDLTCADSAQGGVKKYQDAKSTSGLTPEEEAVFYAEVSEEADRGRVEWVKVEPEVKVRRCGACGKVDVSNSYRVFCPNGAGVRSRSDICCLEGG